LPFKLNLKTDGSAVMQNKQSTLGLLNLASDQHFGLGGKIVQGFGQYLASRNLQTGTQVSEISEFGGFSFNKSVMSLSGQAPFNRR